MSSTLPPQLDWSDSASTRLRLHDIAKIIGKVQQSLLASQPHDWHYGIRVTSSGFASQTFELDNRPTELKFDFANTQLNIGDMSWKTDGRSSSELFDTLSAWVAEKSASSQLAKPELHDMATHFDTHVANDILHSYQFAQVSFAQLAGRLAGGEVSPVLLYPHHFDVSLSWFPDAQSSSQYTCGYLLGDEIISEPYFYVTATDVKTLKAKPLTPPAYWHTNGFEGAVLLHKDLQQCDDHQNVANKYLATSFL